MNRYKFQLAFPRRTQQVSLQTEGQVSLYGVWGVDLTYSSLSDIKIKIYAHIPFFMYIILKFVHL